MYRNCLLIPTAHSDYTTVRILIIDKMTVPGGVLKKAGTFPVLDTGNSLAQS